MDNQIALDIQNLSVYYYVKDGVVKAIDGLNLQLRRGETLGIVGESGSGKSVLTHAIGQEIRNPGKIVGGKIIYEGKNILEYSKKEKGQIYGNDITFTISDPRSALNPLLTVGESIINVIRTHNRVSKNEAYEKMIGMLESVGINDAVRRAASYPHSLSGGMAQRVVVALALINSPKILVADEPTFALDVTIQAQILDMLAEMVENASLSTMIITRDLGIAANYCNRVCVLYAGQIVEIADVYEIFSNPQHPYTISLIECTKDREKGMQSPLLGYMVDLKHLPPGCYMNDVCPYRKTICKDYLPELIDIGNSHFVRCHLASVKE